MPHRPPWRRLTGTILLPVAIVVALIGIVWFWQGRTAERDLPPPTELDEAEEAREAARTAAPGVGRLAPHFALSTLGQTTLAPSDFRGHPVIVLFWATWCEPCVEEMPLLAELREQHADDGLVVLAVNVEEGRDVVQAFEAEHSTPFPLLLDEDGEATRQYRVVGVPSTFFIDRKGVLRAQFFGPVARADLDALLSAILGTDEP